VPAGTVLTYGVTRDDRVVEGLSGEVTVTAGKRSRVITLTFDYALGTLPDTSKPLDGGRRLGIFGVVAILAAFMYVFARPQRSDHPAGPARGSWDRHATRTFPLKADSRGPRC
jgi:hypothetical protein